MWLLCGEAFFAQEMYRDTARESEGYKGFVVSWVCWARPTELVVQAGHLSVEPPHCREQALCCRTADEGVGVVEMAAIDGKKNCSTGPLATGGYQLRPKRCHGGRGTMAQCCVLLWRAC